MGPFVEEGGDLAVAAWNLLDFKGGEEGEGVGAECGDGGGVGADTDVVGSEMAGFEDCFELVDE